MRALFSGAVLAPIMAGVIASTAQATEPSMSFYYSMMQGVSPQECLQRGRNALTGHQFRLAESTQNSQFATQGDLLALVSCVPSQPTVFFLSIAGPQGEFQQFNSVAQRIRNLVVTGRAEGAPTGPRPNAPPPAGTK
jgi:hypothetical protein